MQVLILLPLLGLTALIASAQKYPPEPCDRTIAESELRKNFVQSQVKPRYPPASLAKQEQGLVVVQVCVQPAGKPPIFDIATAPNQNFAKEVLAALRNWKFAPMWLKNRPDVHLAYASKLTFYFV